MAPENSEFEAAGLEGPDSRFSKPINRDRIGDIAVLQLPHVGNAHQVRLNWCEVDGCGGAVILGRAPSCTLLTQGVQSRRLQANFVSMKPDHELSSVIW